ncbi:hypothetical protein [Methylorubrum podarium]|uniref:hypothetical protein n=1 Tax=Methylorubrum podarium TaxID=200476 RepID=UPI001EE1DA49|nr:hypothetical protein [Methylorubrum podarium]MDV2986122.1 hypothetical protein [Methylobacteriaceae bacterium AG10]
MKNLTITLDEDLFAWARIEAAKRGQSLSRFVADTLTERRAPDIAGQLAILDEFFEGPGWAGAAEDWPRRDEIYDRPALLRHERDRLPARSEGSRQEAGKHGADSGGAGTSETRGEPADPQ